MQQSIASFFCPTKIFLGESSYQKLKDILRGSNYRRLFIAVDGALLSSDFYQRILALLKELEVESASFSDIEPDPSVHTVNKAFAVCKQLGAQATLALGGGSTIDVAKAVGILMTSGGRIHDYEGIEKFSIAPIPLIAIPTTAGTGSEVSGSCVISDTEKNLKMSIRHALLNPASYAILDPLAVRTVPAHVAAHSGIDAFVHAFESYISLGANLLTDAINLQAMALLSANIRSFVADRSDMQAGLNMLSGSALAGITFGQTGLGNVHCMARFVGAQLHLSHGLSNALCLPHVARFNMPVAEQKYANVAQVMGEDVRGLPVTQAAQRAVDAIERMCRDLAIPEHLAQVGAKPEMLEDFAISCEKAGYNRWNPRHTSKDDFLKLFEAAL
jgi:alcohol dehydrogenase